MAFTTHQGARLYWRLEGAADKPVLVLLNSIGTDLSVYDRVAPGLLGDFRLLRIDARGHGASEATPGDYSLDLLVGDVLAVMDAAGVERAAICGLSLGGMTAMTLALRAPQRVEALVLACTSAAMDAELWRKRIETIRTGGGMASVVDMALGRFFSDAFRQSQPALVETVRTSLLAMNPDGYAGCGAAIRDMDIASRLSTLRMPTLVISGSRDISTPFEGHGQRIAEAIPGAQTALLDAAHLCVLEAPSAFVAAVKSFLMPPGTAEAADLLFEAGLKTRRKVLGDEWVDKALASRNAFNADYQALITRYAWNEIWSRPGLDHRTRRFLVLAICAALGRWEEFRLHVRAGLQSGGFTQDELKEVLMQTAVYAGVPAGNTAFHEAMDVIREVEAD